MINSEIEKLNLAIVRGGKAYEEWDRHHKIASYLTIILYELLQTDKLTQKQIVNRSNYPKQSINKGIHKLQQDGYLSLTIDPNDNRLKYCQLTPSGRRYAQKKLASLIKAENQVANKLGPEKMKQLVELNEEWSKTFWEVLEKEKRESNQ
ncbi:MarR family winged helix-turn-helix transcriptional regulator [uncultured Lactobacillus sp.]|uniref:MarR family winged helix-turn-helix transcriptional regulator n=1 Tax=uncultured Lactobacillus sp. TaxID=153152 RepID=UPI002608374E|nr:MarR family transcriptional regulator [uncultured Lactobacillus sp.]